MDMSNSNSSAISNGLRYLEDRGWTELIDSRWTIDVREELERSGLGLAENEIIEICNVAIVPKPDWNTKERLGITNWPTRQDQINTSIKYNAFSEHTLQLIDNYINEILNGRTNIDRFNIPEHAGLCTAGAPLIGAYIVCNYARRSLEPSRNATESQASSPANWDIDAKQEELVQQWAEAKRLWFPHAEQLITNTFGPKIAEGAEAKVYYKGGCTSVVKARTSIYSTFGKALEAIVLHNTLFPETQMSVIGFTRDSDGLFRCVLTQPYIGCKRLATKAEIDEMVATKGFRDNYSGKGVNYIGERLYLEDMHPANVFVDILTNKPTCIDCIVKFINK
ncbi:MAG: hypothetical protein J6W06_11710 [Bacteroidales bacterium]|nr:hypothetical protein [Bacteroidales bacterium]